MPDWKTVTVGDSQRQCMGCMGFFDSKFDICPHCGYQVGTPAASLLHLDPGTILAGKYIIGKALGFGGFGVTYVGWDKQLERRVAIKEYYPSEFATRMMHEQDLIIASGEKKHSQYTAGKEKFLEEGKKLAQVGDIEGIVHMYDCFEANNTAYIVMEYLEGETLATLLEREKKLTEQQTMDIMIPILQALSEVHEKGIFHRDIAPDNVFLTKDEQGKIHAKLIDFGAAKFLTTSHSKSLTVLIKQGYSPEEQYQTHSNQGKHTDVYSAAAVMYRMVTGEVPPDALERRASLESKKKDLLDPPGKYNPDLTKNVEVALLNAMNVRIEDRTETAPKFIRELVSAEPVAERRPTVRRIDFGHWPIWAKIGVPLASVAAVGLLIFAGTKIFHAGTEDYKLPEGMTRVPNFMTAASFEQAEEWASDARITINNTGGAYMPNTAEGLVLNQDPVAGSVIYENEIVAVTVSIGQETFVMPDVTGLSADEARAAVECMDMTVEFAEISKPGLASGSVVTQSIAPYEEVHSGDAVTLEVTGTQESAGGKVPYLLGHPYESALQEAADSGILLKVTKKVFSAEVSEPTVEEQSLAADTELEANEVLEITVAMPMREFTMPNLVYKDQAKAKQLLKNIGIDAKISEEMSEAVDVGVIFNQSVEADTTVAPGAEVTLSVSKGGKPVAVPDVGEMTEEEARKALSEKGLAVKVEYGYDEKVAEGSVISQSVKGGEEASKGSAVTIVVCSSDGLVKVANVVGMTSGDAQSALTKQGLKVQVNEVNNTVEKGKVIEQLPAAGTMQKPDTTIVITVSKGAAPATPKPATPAPSTPKPANTPGPWSSWSTSKPSGNYDVEQKTQYRYRDKETTSSTSSSMSGWTQTGSSTSTGDWGGWSGWSSSSVSANDNRQVETRSAYHYYYFVCSNCGAHMHGYGTCYTWAGGCGQNTIPESSYTTFRSTVPYSNTSEFHGTGVNYAYTDYGLSFAYTHSGNQYYVAPETQYRYRERSVTTTYYYERWGNWSAWQDNSVSSSSNRQVETQTVYRYRTKGSN